jgi:cytochrome c oxidase assembly protein subunit 15
LGTILSGLGMAYFAVPPFLQPVHLLLATLTFGVEFYLALQLNRTTKPVLS